ncbi:MAG: 2-oxoacid:acceptor oxidoreductase subunit alpha [Ruminococcaceae bacterium]|jgi:2-oxoglutarate ferredoxin oxidoreductase subunit alpha|nr:2-oxoacid:acceptor oxidoreductase subunit alpha [Oscillospiraceae bacterium]
MAYKRFALLQGNEACVEGAIAAGMRFYSGYPITPSTEIAENSAVRLPQVGGKFIQMEDEIGGIAAAIGASVAGVKAMTATSGPGFSLKQENIGYAAMAEIPLVVVDVQRSGPSTGLPTSPSQGDVMQTRWGTHGDHPIIVVSPSSVQETYNLTVRAFNLSEKYHTPVILMMDEIVGHLREGVELIPAEELEIVNREWWPERERARHPYRMEPGQLVPKMTPFGGGVGYNITGLSHDGEGFPTNSNEKTAELMNRLFDKINKNLDDIVTYEEQNLDDAEIAVVTFGGAARSVMGAIDKARSMGMKVGMFRPITVWPFPEEQVRALAKKVKHILVVEHNNGQLVLEVERLAGGSCPVSLLGRMDGSVIKPDEIVEKLKEVSK